MKIQNIREIEEENIYFRVTDSEDDLTGNSVETANVTREEAATLFNVDIEDLDERLADTEMYYDDDKVGIYWNGICASSTFDEMVKYFGLESGNLTGMESLDLVIFKGSWIDDCGDGEVVEMIEILERIKLVDIMR